MLKVKELIDDRNLLIKKEDCKINIKKDEINFSSFVFKIYYPFLHFHL